MGARGLKEIIFDFDGVISDSLPDQYMWFEHITNVLIKKDLEDPSRNFETDIVFPYKNIEEFRADYMEPVYPGMYEFLKLRWDDNKDIIWSEYNKYKANAKIPLFEGAVESLEKISTNGVKLIVVSSNTHAAINKQLEDHNISKYFRFIIAKDDLDTDPKTKLPLLKPNPNGLLKALDRIGCEPHEAVYVGDQPSDIQTARNVADYRGTPVRTVAVTYGYAPKEKMIAMHADLTIHKPEYLHHIMDVFK